MNCARCWLRIIVDATSFSRPVFLLLQRRIQINTSDSLHSLSHRSCLSLLYIPEKYLFTCIFLCPALWFSTPLNFLWLHFPFLCTCHSGRVSQAFSRLDHFSGCSIPFPNHTRIPDWFLSQRHPIYFTLPAMSMAFSLDDTQNSVPGLSTMAEQQKLSVAPRKADTQSVTKRFDQQFTQQEDLLTMVQTTIRTDDTYDVPYAWHFSIP